MALPDKMRGGPAAGAARRDRTGRNLVLLLTLALALRLAFLLLAGVNSPLTGDELAYQQIAQNVAAGRGFVQTDNPFYPGQPFYAWQAPLYPLTLAALYLVFGVNLLAARLVGVLLGTAAVLVTYDLARRIFRRTRPALLAGLFVAMYPGLLTLAHLLLSETLFTFLLVLAFDLIAYAVDLGAPSARGPRWGGIIAAGAAWGAATLTRGLTLYFVAPFALWFAWALRKELRRAPAAVLLFAGAMAAVLAPWALRNAAVFHEFVLLETKGGVNFLLGNSPLTPNDFIRNVWKVGVREPILAGLPDGEIARDRTAYARGLAYVESEPLTFLARAPFKFADFWGFERNLVDAADATRRGGVGGWTSPGKIAADFLSDAAYVLLVLLAIGGFVFAPNDLWKLLIGAFVVYFVFAHVVVFGDGRFHLPLIPFLALYAGWFASNRQGAARRGWQAAAAGALVVVMAAVWLHELAAALAVLRGA